MMTMTSSALGSAQLSSLGSARSASTRLVPIRFDSFVLFCLFMRRSVTQWSVGRCCSSDTCSIAAAKQPTGLSFSICPRRRPCPDPEPDPDSDPSRSLDPFLSLRSVALEPPQQQQLSAQTHPTRLQKRLTRDLGRAQLSSLIWFQCQLEHTHK